MTWFMAKKAKQKGFTLVETVIVVAIIGILAAIAVPNFLTWLPNMRLKAAGRDLKSNMQKTRTEAIKTNHDWAIVFDTANNRYLICSDRGVDNTWSATADNTITETIDLTAYGSGIGFGHGSVPAGNNSATTPAAAFPADEVDYTSPEQNVLAFNPQGIGSGGYVYLENGDGTALAIGTQTSGVIMLKRWLGGSWQ